MRCACLAWLMLVGVLSCPATGQAQDRKGEGKPAEIEVWAIRATTKNSDVSPELRELADALKKQFKYTGFKLERKAAGRAEMDKSFSTGLVGGYKATATPRQRIDGRIKLQIQVQNRVSQDEQTVLNTTVTAEAGKLVPLGCGPLEGGDYLIIAVRAR